MKVRIEARHDVPAWLRLATIVLALVASLAVLMIILATSGHDPLDGVVRLLRTGFASSWGLPGTVEKTVVLSLLGFGLALAFKAKFWNIGAEGQLIAGAIAAVGVGLQLGGLPGPLALVIMGVSGTIAGALWGMLAAWLKNSFAVNETISTLMLNYVIIQFGSFLINGPWRGHDNLGKSTSDYLAKDFWLWVFPGSYVAPVLIVAVAVLAVVGWFVVYRSTFGYELRVYGENADAAKYAGINGKNIALAVMAISGGLAGLAGFGIVSAHHHQLVDMTTISQGFGFSAIIVAWLARLNPALVPVAAFLFSGLITGGLGLKTSIGISEAIVQVLNGTVLLFLILSEFFTGWKLRLERKEVA